MTTTKQQKWGITHAGMNKATNAASAKIPNWPDKAYYALEMYCQVHADEGPFCADEVRRWATDRGLPEPPSRWAWGGVFNKAAKRELVKKVFVANYHYPESDGTHVKQTSFWIVDQYKCLPDS